MTTLRTVDNKRYTTGSDNNYYVNSGNIIEETHKQRYNDTPKTRVNGNSILNSISLPIRHLIDKSIGQVLAQVKPQGGEGRGNPDSTLTLSYPLQCRKLQKGFHTCIIRHLPIDTSKNIAVQKDTECADIPGVPIVPLQGVMDKTGIF